MKNTLVYVDKNLSIGIASRLIGLQQQEIYRTDRGAAFSWLIQGSINYGEDNSIARDIREMLPEDIIYEIYPNLDNEIIFENVEKCVRSLAVNGEKRILPGRPISVQGIIKFSDFDEQSWTDAFSPPNFNIRTFYFHNEICFIGVLEDHGFRLPIYFLESAQNQVLFTNKQPVEVTGIVRWVPPYSPGGAQSLNLAIRAAALWLR